MEHNTLLVLQVSDRPAVKSRFERHIFLFSKHIKYKIKRGEKKNNIRVDHRAITEIVCGKHISLQLYTVAVSSFLGRNPVTSCLPTFFSSSSSPTLSVF